jgi:hypothetical protein
MICLVPHIASIAQIRQNNYFYLNEGHSMRRRHGSQPEISMVLG